MDALKRSLASEKQSAPAAAKTTEKAKGKKPRKAAAGQREMLLPISGSGKRAAKQEPKKARSRCAHRPDRRKRARCAARARTVRSRKMAGCSIAPEMPWSTPFDEPIRCAAATELATLQQAADHIMRLPEDVQQQERWQIAVKT